MPTPQQNGGWNVVSTAPAPAISGDGWNVVSTQPLQNATPSHAVPQQGLLSSFADTSGLSLLGQVLRHPIDTAATVLDAGKQVFTPANANVPLSQSSNPLLKGIGDAVHAEKAQVGKLVSDVKAGGLRPSKNINVGDDLMRALPVAGGVYAKAVDQADAGNYAGAAGSVLGLGAGLAGPEYAAKGLQAVAPAIAHPLDTLAKPLRSGLDEPLPGAGSLTPRARYQSAKRVGVQLDAADATNAPALTMLKAVNRDRLMAAPTYEKALADNKAALQNSTDGLLNSMYDGDREGGGAAIHTALKNDQQSLQQAATQGFQSLPRDLPIPGSANVGKTAREIAAGQAAYQSQFPSLIPKQAMSVVDDASNLALPNGAYGPEKVSNFGTMQQLRSDLLEMGRANPDLVKNQGGGFFQRLAGDADAAITDAGTGLPPELQPTFRDANAKWADLKSTYDDPSNPLYHAVRTNTPSTLYNGSGLGPKTPEAVRALLPRLGQTAENLQPDAVGALRRGTVESALKTTNDGSPNFKTFGTQLNRIPADYRAELFTLPQNQRLQDIANTSNLLGQDLNPSGTSKQLGKLADFHSMAPLAAYELGHGNVGAATAAVAAPLLHYPLAKFINWPSFTEFLMRQPRASGNLAPIRATWPAALLPLMANPNPPRR